jgi:hypothetical protein
MDGPFLTQTLVSILPFVLLLVLWFFLLKSMGKGAQAKNKKNFIDPMQEMLEKAIVPEVRALRESVDALRADFKARDEEPK